MAGNAFRSQPAPGRDGFRREGHVAWGDAAGVFSIFFHIDRPAVLDLALRAQVPEGRSQLVSRVNRQSIRTQIEGKDLASHTIGRFEIPGAGYVRVDLQGQERVGNVFAEIHALQVTSETSDLRLDFVRSNEGNMFYWGRRGPSVHLRYEVPRDRKLQFAYSQITVPPGQDPIGSFFMANGFGEGYFGIQVNGPDERRVLFSVWSPFQTNNPGDIPDDQRVVLLAKGDGVQVGEFGNEGSGGQSYLVYPWKSGHTYGFLTEVKPDEGNSTTYTSWFRDQSEGPWHLIASLRRPRTQTSLRGLHSFLESFDPNFGLIGRRASYGNVWVRDTEGQWFECTRARLTVDATGRDRHRLDFTGGIRGDTFFLRTCGFFDETGTPGETYTRPSTAGQQPDIDIEKLPRN